MTGVVWFVQVVHYPLFPGSPATTFPHWQSENVRRTRRLVLPVMLAETGTALALAAARPASTALQGGLLLLALVWLSTLLVQLPIHTRLQTAFDPAGHLRLVRSNWVRTAAWTARSVLALGFLPG